MSKQELCDECNNETGEIDLTEGGVICSRCFNETYGGKSDTL